MYRGHIIDNCIAINYCNSDKDDHVHFLTHIETGISLESVENVISSTAATIYTSAVNAYILKAHFNCERDITPVEFGKTYQVYTRNKKLFIFTCIRSYYNCGSMMLIVRGEFGTLIYTGFSAINCDSFNSPIISYIIEQKSVTKLYMDCTYYQSNLKFFSVDDIKRSLIQFFRSRRGRFYIHVPIFGLEDLLGQVACSLKETMSVDEKRMTLIKFLDLSEYFTLDKSKSRLHVISQGIIKKNKDNDISQLVYIKVVNTFSNSSNSYMNDGKIHFFTLYPHCTSSDCEKILKYTNPQEFIPIGSPGGPAIINPVDQSCRSTNKEIDPLKKIPVKKTVPVRDIHLVDQYLKETKSFITNLESSGKIRGLNSSLLAQEGSKASLHSEKVEGSQNDFKTHDSQEIKTENIDEELVVDVISSEEGKEVKNMSLKPMENDYFASEETSEHQLVKSQNKKNVQDEWKTLNVPINDDSIAQRSDLNAFFNEKGFLSVSESQDSKEGIQNNLKPQESNEIKAHESIKDKELVKDIIGSKLVVAGKDAKNMPLEPMDNDCFASEDTREHQFEVKSPNKKNGQDEWKTLNIPINDDSIAQRSDLNAFFNEKEFLNVSKSRDSEENTQNTLKSQMSNENIKDKELVNDVKDSERVIDDKKAKNIPLQQLKNNSCLSSEQTREHQLKVKSPNKKNGKDESNDVLINNNFKDFLNSDINKFCNKSRFYSDSKQVINKASKGTEFKEVKTHKNIKEKQLVKDAKGSGRVIAQGSNIKGFLNALKTTNSKEDIQNDSNSQESNKIFKNMKPHNKNNEQYDECKAPNAPINYDLIEQESKDFLISDINDFFNEKEFQSVSKTNDSKEVKVHENIKNKEVVEDVKGSERVIADKEVKSMSPLQTHDNCLGSEQTREHQPKSPNNKNVSTNNEDLITQGCDAFLQSDLNEYFDKMSSEIVLKPHDSEEANTIKQEPDIDGEGAKQIIDDKEDRSKTQESFSPEKTDEHLLQDGQVNENDKLQKVEDMKNDSNLTKYNKSFAGSHLKMHLKHFLIEKKDHMKSDQFLLRSDGLLSDIIPKHNSEMKNKSNISTNDKSTPEKNVNSCSTVDILATNIVAKSNELISDKKKKKTVKDNKTSLTEHAYSLPISKFCVNKKINEIVLSSTKNVSNVNTLKTSSVHHKISPSEESLHELNSIQQSSNGKTNNLKFFDKSVEQKVPSSDIPKVIYHKEPIRQSAVTLEKEKSPETDIIKISRGTESNYNNKDIIMDETGINLKSDINLLTPSNSSLNNESSSPKLKIFKKTTLSPKNKANCILASSPENKIDITNISQSITRKVLFMNDKKKIIYMTKSPLDNLGVDMKKELGKKHKLDGGEISDKYSVISSTSASKHHISGGVSEPPVILGCKMLKRFKDSSSLKIVDNSKHDQVSAQRNNYVTRSSRIKTVPSKANSSHRVIFKDGTKINIPMKIYVKRHFIKIPVQKANEENIATCIRKSITEPNSKTYESGAGPSLVFGNSVEKISQNIQRYLVDQHNVTNNSNDINNTENKLSEQSGNLICTSPENKSNIEHSDNCNSQNNETCKSKTPCIKVRNLAELVTDPSYLTNSSLPKSHNKPINCDGSTNLHESINSSALNTKGATETKKLPFSQSSFFNTKFSKKLSTQRKSTRPSLRIKNDIEMKTDASSLIEEKINANKQDQSISNPANLVKAINKISDDEVVIEPTSKMQQSDNISPNLSPEITIKKKKKRKRSVWMKNIKPKRKSYKSKPSDITDKSTIVGQCVSNSSVNTNQNEKSSDALNSSSDSSYKVHSPTRHMQYSDPYTTILDKNFKGDIIVNLPDRKSPTSRKSVRQIASKQMQSKVYSNYKHFLHDVNKSEEDAKYLEEYKIQESFVRLIRDFVDTPYKYSERKRCFIKGRNRNKAVISAKNKVTVQYLDPTVQTFRMISQIRENSANDETNCLRDTNLHLSISQNEDNIPAASSTNLRSFYSDISNIIPEDPLEFNKAKNVELLTNIKNSKTFLSDLPFKDNGNLGNVSKEVSSCLTQAQSNSMGENKLSISKGLLEESIKVDHLPGSTLSSLIINGGDSNTSSSSALNKNLTDHIGNKCSRPTFCVTITKKPKIFQQESSSNEDPELSILAVSSGKSSKEMLNNQHSLANVKISCKKQLGDSENLHTYKKTSTNDTNSDPKQLHNTILNNSKKEILTTSQSDNGGQVYEEISSDNIELSFPDDSLISAKIIEDFSDSIESNKESKKLCDVNVSLSCNESINKEPHIYSKESSKINDDSLIFNQENKLPALVSFLNSVKLPLPIDRNLSPPREMQLDNLHRGAVNNESKNLPFSNLKISEIRSIRKKHTRQKIYSTVQNQIAANQTANPLAESTIKCLEDKSDPLHVKDQSLPSIKMEKVEIPPVLCQTNKELSYEFMLGLKRQESYRRSKPSGSSIKSRFVGDSIIQKKRFKHIIRRIPIIPFVTTKKSLLTHQDDFKRRNTERTSLSTARVNNKVESLKSVKNQSQILTNELSNLAKDMFELPHSSQMDLT